MSRITGGEILIRTLLKAGVSKVFGLHGAHLEAAFQACRDHGVSVVDVRHEVAAGHAAEGYARATGGLGVAMVTAGGGFTNVLTSVANAYIDRTPVLYIVGGAPLRDVETNTLQGGFNQMAMVQPVTKWAHQITSPDLIPRLIAQAVRIALAGPRGPVVIEIPMDVMMAQVEADAVEIPETVGLDSPPAPQARLVEQALDLLSSAARPVILAGDEARKSGVADVLLDFAAAHRIPVFTDFEAHGVIPADDPLYGGTLQHLADFAENQRPDVVLALGLRLGLFTFGGSDIVVPQAAKFIHIDPDPKELGRLRAVDVAIVADARETVLALKQAGARRNWPDFTGWGVTVAERRKARRAAVEASAGPGAPIHPFHVVSTVLDAAGPTAVVVADGAETYSWVNEAIRQTEPGTYLTHGFYGSMGIGLGLALGAKAARPDRPLICIIGDGAVGFTIAEFDTMVRNHLPIVVVVVNNQSWGACQHLQEAMSGVDRVFATRLGQARYDEVAKGFGCFGAYVTDLADLRPAVEAALASGRPACINVQVDLAPIPPEVLLLMRATLQ
jgi:acetolactate synthase-1/2/3 large subunit